ncbi:hypothetical protein M422DRAFT_38839, partial [Sphaerobolus stellatus SS14]
MAEAGDRQVDFDVEQFFNHNDPGYLHNTASSNSLSILTENGTQSQTFPGGDWGFSPSTEGSNGLCTPMSPDYYPPSGAQELQDSNNNTIYSNTQACVYQLEDAPLSGPMTGPTGDCNDHGIVPVFNTYESEDYLGLDQFMPGDEAVIAEHPEYGQDLMDVEVRIKDTSVALYQPASMANLPTLNHGVLPAAYVDTVTNTPASPIRITDRDLWPEGFAIKEMYIETEEEKRICSEFEAQVTIEYLLHHKTKKQMKYWVCNGHCPKGSKTMSTREHAMDHVAAEHFPSLGARFQCKKCPTASKSLLSIKKHCVSIHTTKRDALCLQCGRRGRNDYIKGEHQQHCPQRGMA